MTPTADPATAAGGPAASRRRRFTKMHGAGNDFVVLDLRHGAPPPSGNECRALADRHLGVGCDQILTIETPRTDTAIAAYRIWNADGTASQQCGNGARCVAAWLVRDAQGEPDPLPAQFTLDSPAGLHVVDVLDDDASGVARFRIAMGVPVFAPADVPLQGFAEVQDSYLLDIDGVELAIAAVSLGNPHVVIVVEDVDHAPVASVGTAVQQHGALPESANVGFVQVISRSNVRLRVYERGVGETLACGSGACAAAAVLMRRGLVDRAVSVSLPGGELEISWPGDASEVTMVGPAAFVYEGEWMA